MTTSCSDGPGTSTPCHSDSVPNRQVGSSSANCLTSCAGGVVALAQQRHARAGRAARRWPAGRPASRRTGPGCGRPPPSISSAISVEVGLRAARRGRAGAGAGRRTGCRCAGWSNGEPTSSPVQASDAARCPAPLAGGPRRSASRRSRSCPAPHCPAGPRGRVRLAAPRPPGRLAGPGAAAPTAGPAARTSRRAPASPRSATTVRCPNSRSAQQAAHVQRGHPQRGRAGRSGDSGRSSQTTSVRSRCAGPNAASIRSAVSSTSSSAASAARRWRRAGPGPRRAPLARGPDGGSARGSASRTAARVERRAPSGSTSIRPAGAAVEQARATAARLPEPVGHCGSSIEPAAPPDGDLDARARTARRSPPR